jgi:hypothetical protein
MNTDEPPPDVPDDALVQSIVVDAEGKRSGYRIFGDGRYETLAGAWTAGTPLDAKRLQAVQDAIATVPLDGLAGRYEQETGETDPNVLWFQVVRDGTLRTVSVVGSRRVPELEQLTARLTDAFR